jgi:uncharacterized protein (TIGR02466 family)
VAKRKAVEGCEGYFATPVLSIRLGLDPSLRRKMLLEIERIRQVDEAGLKWSKKNYRSGYTSYASLDHLHVLSPLFSKFERRVDLWAARYAKAWGWKLPKNRRRWVMTDLWANVMGRGCYHRKHQHPNSQISGAYYLEVPRNAAPLRLWDPRGACEDASVDIQPGVDQLVLFPSWLWHEVPVQKTKGPRVGLSFNYL